MNPRFSAARAAIIIAGGVMLLAATSTADAQRRDPRVAAAARKRPAPVTPPAGPIGLASSFGRFDGRFDLLYSAAHAFALYALRRLG